jgi:glyoxylase-like metal-dependent hydrolase (beta-lactamase superfamily II)
VSEPEYQIATIVSDDFQENSYVAHLRGSGQCFIVDPGLEPEDIISYLDQHGLVPTAILNTHGHLDHIAGNAALKTRWPACPLVIGEGDAEKLVNPRLNMSGVFGFPLTSPPADATVREGDVYSAAGFDLEILSIPGHSAGHVVYFGRRTIRTLRLWAT